MNTSLPSRDRGRLVSGVPPSRFPFFPLTARRLEAGRFLSTEGGSFFFPLPPLERPDAFSSSPWPIGRVSHRTFFFFFFFFFFFLLFSRTGARPRFVEMRGVLGGVFWCPSFFFSLFLFFFCVGEEGFLHRDLAFHPTKTGESTTNSSEGAFAPHTFSFFPPSSFL